MLKLMIVDDEPLILSGIRDMVERGNTAFTKIVTAGDGLEAMEIVGLFSSGSDHYRYSDARNGRIGIHPPGQDEASQTIQE